MNLISVSATRTHTHELERLYHFVDYCLAKKDSHFFVLLQIKIILAQHLWKCCIGVNPTKDIINRPNTYSCNYCNLPQKKHYVAFSEVLDSDRCAVAKTIFMVIK